MIDHDLWGKFPDAATHFMVKRKGERGWDPVGIPAADGLERREIPVEFVDAFRLVVPGDYRLFFLEEVETENGGRTWRPLGMSRVVGYHGETEEASAVRLNVPRADGGASNTPPMRPPGGREDGGDMRSGIPSLSGIEGVLSLLAGIRALTAGEVQDKQADHQRALEREQAWWQSRMTAIDAEHKASRERDREFLQQVVAIVTSSASAQVDMAKGELDRAREDRARESEATGIDVAQSAVEAAPMIIDHLATALRAKSGG